MPINTRSKRREVNQSPAKSSALKPELRTNLTAKPPRAPPKTKKAKEEPVPSSSRRMAREPVLAQPRSASTDVSATKQPKSVDNFSSVRSKPDLKLVKNTGIGKNEKIVDLKAEFVGLSDFISAALSKRREFYEMFKEAEDEFDKDFEFGKQLIEQKSTVSQKIPLSHTPLGKKFYATLNASSALKFNKDPPKPTKRLRSPEESSSVDRGIDMLPSSFEFGKGSPGRKKLIMENVALTTLNEEEPLTNVTYVQQPTKNIAASALANANYNIQKTPTNAEHTPTLANVTYIQKEPVNVEPATTIADGTYVQENPVNVEPPSALANVIDDPNKLIKELAAPGPSKVSNVQQRTPEAVETLPTLSNATYIQKKPDNEEPTSTDVNFPDIQKKPMVVEQIATIADATFVQNKPVHVEPTTTIANATYVQKKQGKKPAPGLSNATYVQKKGSDLPNSSGDDSSEELFSDEEMKACIGKDQELFPPVIVQDKKSEGSDSTSSSVSALVERFELKKMTKMGSNLKPAVDTMPKVPDVGSCSQEKLAKPIQKEPVLDNATFIFESSVVESPMEKELSRDRSVASTLSTVKFNSLKPCELQKESKVNSKFSKPVAHKMPSVDQTFVVNTNKRPEVSNEDYDSEEELLPPPISDKTYVKDVKNNALVKKMTPPRELELPKKANSSQSSKSGLSTSSSSSGSMKSAVSQPSLTNVLPSTKMGLKNTSTTGSAGTIFEKQKSTAKEAESTYKKRLLEKEEEAAKRKLEIDQRKMELQKKKNEEWKRKAEKMKAEEKKAVPMPATAKVHFAGQSTQGAKGATLNQNPMINILKSGPKQMNTLKPSGSSSVFPSKFNPKLLMPSSDPQARNYEEPCRGDESFRTADGCSFLDMTIDVDPANNYDITRYEDIDEECKHREHKSIPDWARGDNINHALFKQIPYEVMAKPFFSKADAKFRLFPNFGK